MKEAKLWARNFKTRIDTLVNDIDVAQSEPSANFAAGKLFEFIGEAPKAIEYYRKAIAVCDDSEMHARLSLALLKAGRKEEALKTATNLVSTSPDARFTSLGGYKTSVQAVMGDVLRANGHSEAALASYEKALAIEPTDPYASGSAALLLLAIGRVDEARKLKEKLPEMPRFAELRATLNLLSNDPNELPAIGGPIRAVAIDERMI